jgi:hypothetical protein
LKKLLFPLLLVLSICGIQAQEEKAAKKYQNCISYDVFRGLISGEDIYRRQFSFERAINEKFSALIGYETGQFEFGSISVGPSFSNLSTTEEYTVKGSALLLEGRFYPFRKGRESPKGFFLGSYFKQYWLEERNVSDDVLREFEKKHSLSVFGLDMGYKFGKRWFMIEPLLGFGIASSSEIGEDPRIDPTFSNYEPSNYSVRIGINIGVCF